MKNNIKLDLIVKNLQLENMSSLGGGYLDWVTGTMRINFSSNEYNQIKNGNIELWQKYLETIIHEMFHFFQIVTSGYMYNYSLDITNEMVDLYFSKNKTLAKYFISGNFPKSTTHLINLTKKINDFEQNNLAPIHLMEGMALFAQCMHKTNKQGNDLISPEYFLKVINFYNRYNKIYSSAYTSLCNAIGNENAFFIFPSLVYYCLQLSRPAYAFVIIKNSLSEFSQQISDNFDDNFKKFQDIFVHIITEKGCLDNLGIIECPLYMTADNHPFFSDFFVKLQESEQFYPADIINAVINPNNITQDLFLEFLRPVLLNDGKLIISKYNGSGIFETQGQLEDMIISSCAMNYQIMSKKNIGLALDKYIDILNEI